MYQFDTPEGRECPGCHFVRIPDTKIVKKRGKSWIIYTCRQCHMRDIDSYTSTKIWNGSSFIDDYTSEEDNEE